MARLYESADLYGSSYSYDGTIVFADGTGSGTGSASSTAVHTHVRTATGSGAGTDTTTGVHVHVRTASGANIAFTYNSEYLYENGLPYNADHYATGVHTHVRAGTGSGVGASTSTGVHTHVRAGTGTGTGTSAATGVHTHVRAGSGTGQGSDTPATWIRLYLFRTPTDLEVDFTGAYRVQLVTQRQRAAFNLYRFYEPGPRGRNVFKLTDGSYTENQPAEDEDIDIVYYGGHNHYVDDVEKSELVAAGYGAYVN